MRLGSDNLKNVLTGSFDRRLIADVFHGADRVMQNLDLTGWKLDWDLTAEVKHSGSGTAVWSSPDGSSLVPSGTDGVLSPFRATLLIMMEISAEGFSETVTLGWAKVTKINSAYDEHTQSPTGGLVVSASVVELEFQGLDANLKRRGFRSPEQIPDLSSCYGELRRITGMPVTETVDDAPIPSAIVYEASQGGRLKGVQDVAGVLGGVAVIDSAGAVKVVSTVQGDPVGELVVGADGTVIDVGYSVDTGNVYNCVVGNFETETDRTPIYSVAEVTTGGLATSGDYGEYTEYFASPLIHTQAGGDLAVQTRLSTSITGQVYDVPVQCVVNPLTEIGDVMAVVGWDHPVQGMTKNVSMSDSVLMDATLTVQRSF